MHCRRECKKATTELFLEQGVVPRSSDAMVAWRSLIDVHCRVHCVCNQMPRMMSRPTPKSGGSRREINGPLHQNNICSSWCEGSGPIRKVWGKPPTGFELHITPVEACGEQPHTCAVPIQLRLDSTPCGRCLFACRSPATCFLFKLVGVQAGKLREFSLRQDLLLTGVAGCSAAMFH